MEKELLECRQRQEFAAGVAFCLLRTWAGWAQGDAKDLFLGRFLREVVPLPMAMAHVVFFDERFEALGAGDVVFGWLMDDVVRCEFAGVVDDGDFAAGANVVSRVEDGESWLAAEI